MSESIDVSDLESVVATLNTIKERIIGGASIEHGEDCYDWILEANEALTAILDRADKS